MMQKYYNIRKIFDVLEMLAKKATCKSSETIRVFITSLKRHHFELFFWFFRRFSSDDNKPRFIARTAACDALICIILDHTLKIVIVAILVLRVQCLRA